MIKTMMMAASIAAFSLSAASAAPAGVSVSQDKHIVIAAPHGGSAYVHVPHRAKSATIYSNLASAYPDGTYFSGEGDTVCGINCGLGESIAVAGGFTPAKAATASEVAVAVGYIQGTDEITLAIFSDTSGAPGTVLWSGVAKSLPTFGECCGVATAKIKGGLALTAGTPYWVVVETDAKESTTFAAWNLATTEQVTAAPAAYNNNNAGWTSYTTILPPAFAVYGK